MGKASGGDPAAARDARFYFEEALRNDPALFPAKYNLELLLKKAQQETEKKKDGSSQEGRQTEEKKELEQTPVVKPPFLGTNP